jgi:hypothetical protein
MGSKISSTNIPKALKARLRGDHDKRGGGEIEEKEIIHGLGDDSLAYRDTTRSNVHCAQLGVEYA